MKEWIKKMKYYSAVKNNEIRKIDGKWIDLEKMIPTEVT